MPNLTGGTFFEKVDELVSHSCNPRDNSVTNLLKRAKEKNAVFAADKNYILVLRSNIRGTVGSKDKKRLRKRDKIEKEIVKAFRDIFQ